VAEEQHRGEGSQRAQVTSNRDQAQQILAHQ